MYVKLFRNDTQSYIMLLFIAPAIGNLVGGCGMSELRSYTTITAYSGVPRKGVS